MTEKNGRPSAATAPPSKATAKPKELLPTDRVQFSKQLDILRAYASLSDPPGTAVTIESVGKITGMAGSTVSTCNPFFADIGLLEKVGKSYVPVEYVLEYQRAEEWSGVAAHRMAPVFEQTWFGKALIPRVKFGQIEEQVAITDLATKAHVTKERKRQLTLLIDYLEAVGIVERDGAILKAGPVIRTNGQRPAPAEEPANVASQPRVVRPTNSAMETGFAKPTQGVVEFQVNVRVDMNEFEGWEADRIKSFFNGIAAVLAAKGRMEKIE